MIVWRDEKNDTLLYISGYFDKKSLFDMAESVKQNKKERTLKIFHSERHKTPPFFVIESRYPGSNWYPVLVGNNETVGATYKVVLKRSNGTTWYVELVNNLNPS